MSVSDLGWCVGMSSALTGFVLSTREDKAPLWMFLLLMAGVLAGVTVTVVTRT